MKFTKEEIRLCKEIARYYRKPIKYGDWYLIKTTEYEDIDVNRSFDKNGKRRRISIKKTFQVCAHCSPKLLDIISLWTWEGAREWLRERNWYLFEHGDWYLNKNEVLVRANPLLDNGEFNYDVAIKRFGKTDLEAILKVVLAVLKEENGKN